MKIDEFVKELADEVFTPGQGGDYETFIKVVTQALADLQSRVTQAECHAVDREALRKQLADVFESAQARNEATQKLEARNMELRRERDEALASLPCSTNRTREQARQLLGEVLRHVTDEKLQSSHGCVEVTNAQRVIDTLIGDAGALRSQLEEARRETGLLREEVVHGFYEDETPSFRQGIKGEHEITEPVTAEWCTWSVAEISKLCKALQFYSHIEDYKAPLTGGFGKLYMDCGQVARAALDGTTKEEK